MDQEKPRLGPKRGFYSGNYKNSGTANCGYIDLESLTKSAMFFSSEPSMFGFSLTLGGVCHSMTYPSF